MKVKRTETVKLADIKVNMFVRKELDADRVLFLAGLIQNGVKMNENIKVTEDHTVIDGRHRKEAYELLDMTEVKVDICFVKDETDLIAEAYKSNTGSSKPPTIADTEHTIMLLLERNETMKRIGELLGLPAGMARKYAGEVKSRMNRAKLQRAAASVTEGGLTTAQAAERHEVDEKNLKEILSGNRKKHKHGIDGLQGKLTSDYRSISSQNGATLRRILEKYEDGDVTAKQVEEVIAHTESLQKKLVRATADWRERFEAIKGGEKTPESAEKELAATA